MIPITRRNFVKYSTAAAALAVVPLIRPRTARAVEPLGRTGKPRLLPSLAAYSFREFFPVMRGKPNTKVPAERQIDLFKFVDFCAGHDCAGAELTSYFFPVDVDQDYLMKLRRHCFLRGVAISGTSVGNNFSHPPGPKRDAEIRETKTWIDRAALLGTSHVRIFAGNTTELPRAEADKLVISAVEECCDYAGKRGIFLGLENHDSIGNADALLAFLKSVNSQWLGINLDSGNFRTDDPYKDFERCVPYAVNVQLKTEIGSGTKGGKQPADLKRLVGILRDGGYQGWVALEYEAKEDPFEAVPRVLAEMKALFVA